jgi:hypothetical protein
MGGDGGKIINSNKIKTINPKISRQPFSSETSFKAG